MQWVCNNIPSTNPDDHKRLSKALVKGDFDVRTHIVGSPTHFMSPKGQSWFRLELNGFMRGVEIVFDEVYGCETWKYMGVHCTSTRGAIGIIRDRRFRAGYYGDCSYCRMTQEPQNFAQVAKDIIFPAFGASKNDSDVIFEVYARAVSR